MNEIVVDTNVFAHTSNPVAAEYLDSQAFVTWLADSTVNICVDPGFSLTTSENQSIIGHEYVTHIPATSVGYFVLAKLASIGRVKTRPRDVDARTKAIIEQRVTDKHDRVFVRVAMNANDRVLMSNDYDDFPATVRQSLKEEIGVSILSVMQRPWEAPVPSEEPIEGPQVFVSELRATPPCPTCTGPMNWTDDQWHCVACIPPNPAR